MIEIIPNWHPVFVHFTVALLSIAALLKLAVLFVSSEPLRAQWQIVARWNLWFGTGITVITVIMGSLAYNSVTHDTPSHAAMTDHRNWALVTALVFVLIAIWSMLRARAGKGTSVALVVALLVATGLLGSTAWRGGEVVYRYGLGVMSLPKPDTHGHAPGVADDHDEMAADMASGEGHGHDEGAADNHHDDATTMVKEAGHDDNTTDDHHSNADAMMNEADSHGHDEAPMGEGKLHTHDDGTVERH